MSKTKLPVHQGKNQIVQHNSIAEARYGMTTNEQKIFLLLIGKIREIENQPQYTEATQNQLDAYLKLKEITPYPTYSIYANEIKWIEQNNKYRDLKKVAKNLVKKIISFKTDNYERDIPVFLSIKYIDKLARIDIIFNPLLHQNLFAFNQEYTKLNKHNIIKFKSKYAIRLFTYLSKSINFKGELTISLKEFKNLMLLDNLKAYEAYSNVHNRIILPAVKEINQLNVFQNFNLSIVKIKKERSVVAIKFVLQNLLTTN